ncbi:hypothetical protein BCR34DRAFT_573940 [Clohesyomyces aquaticus]|uniref:CBM1 domain-containing protein n=1 Tax=Clohesyomyces aquaticus TaxID=1231657 RepID=A0A1Y1YXU8_9PLEO|nr:hypothetical protein BCR34DRAFT_573940 [Clohesyomyces aquaticus]
MIFNNLILLVAAFGSAAYAAQAAYAQCGGKGFTGGTTCVSGYTCKYSNDYYSQCLPSTSGNVVTTKASNASPVKSSAPPKSSSSPSGSGTTYKASFTQYGSTDTWGSGNCNVKTTACGFYTSPGYSAAVSQNEFGVGPGAGAGPGCGTCWKLTAQTDSSGNKLSNAGNSIVVQVTNLCPASGNPLCAQNGLTGTNQYGANLNFDLCIDSGASAALFGNSGVGLAVGNAVQVNCAQWSGKVVG